MPNRPCLPHAPFDHAVKVGAKRPSDLPVLAVVTLLPRNLGNLLVVRRLNGLGGVCLGSGRTAVLVKLRLFVHRLLAVVFVPLLLRGLR